MNVLTKGSTSEQVRQLIAYLQAIDKAIEPAYVLAGEFRDTFYGASTAEEQLAESEINQVFGKIGACGDLVALALGDLMDTIGAKPAN